MAQIEQMQQDLTEFKADVRGQFDGVRADLRELTQALRELIRLDGDIRRIDDKVIRIGAEVDDHENRLREMEKSDAAQTRSVGLFDWLLRHALGILVGGAITAVLLKGVAA